MALRPPGFEEPRGPLVAVCGLVPGAGASTLAYALAEAAARASSAPVLLCEADPAAGSLSALAGAATGHSFSDLCLSVAARRTPRAPFALLPSGLRLIASAPARRGPPAAAALPVLRDAQSAHGLTVVDCGGVARLEALPALEVATHVLWVLPATPLGLLRAQLSLQSLAPRPRGAAEMMVAVATVPSPLAKVGELRELAETCADRLLLVPHIPGLHGAECSPADELGETLADLWTVLRTRP